MTGKPKRIPDAVHLCEELRDTGILFGFGLCYAVLGSMTDAPFSFLAGALVGFAFGRWRYRYADEVRLYRRHLPVILIPIKLMGLGGVCFGSALALTYIYAFPADDTPFASAMLVLNAFTMAFLYLTHFEAWPESRRLLIDSFNDALDQKDRF